MAASPNHLSGQAVDAALKVHSTLGPGLLETAYQACLAHELRCRGIQVRTQVDLPVVYREVRIDIGYRIDVLIEESLIVEIKSVSKIVPVHHAQLLSYLKLSGHRVGLLINFNVTHLRDGIKRMVNG